MDRVHHREQGATFALLMLAVAVMGVTLSIAAQQWKTVVQREKEAELLFRGIEIQSALAAYSAQQKKGRVVPGEIYPLTLEELTKPPKPVLRKAYKDPMTGEDWAYLRDSAGGIKGVNSKSTAEPFKQHDFPPAVQHLEGLTSYTAWVFQYPSASTPQAPVGPVPLGQNIPGTAPITPTPGAPATGPVPINPPPPALVPPPAGM